MKKHPLKPFEILPAHVLRDEYGFNAANRPTIVVAPEEVPDELRFLIPLVERWAIPCDVTRHDYFDHQPEAEVAEFWHGVLPYTEAIHRWLDTQDPDVLRWPKAAVHFMYFLKAHDEAYQPTAEDVRRRQEGEIAWNHRKNLKGAIERGLEAFKAKDYRAVVEHLSPYADELDKVTRAKFAYSLKASK